MINTLAGNGSAITLSILTEVIGLPGNLANGTNRIGIFFQSAASSLAFGQNKKLPLKRSRLIIICTTLGALVGVWLAIRVSNEQFLVVFKTLMVIMLFVILIRPKRWLRSTDRSYHLPVYISIPVFLALGFYGGFIQMGMGVFFLAATVLLARYDIIEANAIKIFVVFVYTIVVLAIFQWRGLVDWKVGSIIAIGQVIGGYLTGQFASRYPKADVWAYWLLVIIVIAVILRMFGWL